MKTINEKLIVETHQKDNRKKKSKENSLKNSLKKLIKKLIISIRFKLVRFGKSTIN